MLSADTIARACSKSRQTGNGFLQSIRDRLFFSCSIKRLNFLSGILASVYQRTQLVGENRLELLLFKLGTRHVLAINVFKVKEVITVPKLNQMPGSHGNLKGVTNYRGSSIPIIDFRQSKKMKPQVLSLITI